MPMPKKIRPKPEEIELNLTPIMNLMLLLIPFLLLSSEFISIAVINVSSPRIGGGAAGEQQEKKKDKPDLNLTVTITDKGFIVAGTGGVLGGEADASAERGGPTVPKVGDTYDYAGLTKKLIEIKDAFPEETKVILGAEPTVILDFLIQTMDATRETEDGRILFPDVILSAGVT